MVTYLANFVQPRSKGLVSIAHGLLDGRNLINVFVKFVVSSTDFTNDLKMYEAR